jgi:steroid delta-isomerase-like uncharacterized protein
MLKLAADYFEIVADGELERLDAVLSADFVQHTPGAPQGPDGARAMLALFRRGFPDFDVTLEWMLVDGDRVVVRSVSSGTHVGPFLGHPPSGRSFSATGLDVLRMAEGRIVERWNEFDTFGMLQQLALVPVPRRPEPRSAGAR